MAGSASPPTDYIPGQVIVSFRPGVHAGQSISRHGLQAEPLPALDAWLIAVTPGEEQTVLEQLAQDPSVAYAERVYRVSAQ